MADDPNEQKPKENGKKADKDKENQQNQENQENEINPIQQTPSSQSTPLQGREESSRIQQTPSSQSTPLQSLDESSRTQQTPLPGPAPLSNVEETARLQQRQRELAEETQALMRQIAQTQPPPITMPPRRIIDNQPQQNNLPQPNQQQQNGFTNFPEGNQIPVIIIVRRQQRRSEMNPFLLPLRRPTIPTYTPLRLGREPTRVICPVCQERILTMVILEPKHPKCLSAFLLCTIPCCCCCWPCVCLPYCMDSCQNANHYCPNCNAYVGTFEN